MCPKCTQLPWRPYGGRPCCTFTGWSIITLRGTQNAPRTVPSTWHTSGAREELPELEVPGDLLKIPLEDMGDVIVLTGL